MDLSRLSSGLRVCAQVLSRALFRFLVVNVGIYCVKQVMTDPGGGFLYREEVVYFLLYVVRTWEVRVDAVV